jgi:hypothetical protein
LRSGPSLEASVIGAIAGGTTLELTETRPVRTEDADFYAVRLPNGSTGYAAPAPQDLPAAPSTTNVPLRGEPLPNAPIVATLPAGARTLGVDFVTLNYVENWVLVRGEVGGRTVQGYIHGSAYQLERFG